MRTRWSFSVMGSVIMALLTVSFMLGGIPQAFAQSKPITLKAVSFVPRKNLRTRQFQKLIDKINENAKGELEIKLLGGPEAIGQFEQGMAVKQGVVDMAFLPPAFYDKLAPGGGMLALSRLAPAEERKRGIYDILDEAHQKNGLKFLGRGSACSTLLITYIWLNKEIQKPQELKGMRIFGGVYFLPILRAFGATEVSMPQTEAYTALERGLVEGAANPVHQVIGFAWYEHLKYVINHPLLGISIVMLIVNLDKWNSMPAHLHKVVQDSIIEMEPVLDVEFRAEYEKMWKKLRDHGIKSIEFSPEDAKWYVETANEAKWADELKKYPVVGGKLKDLIAR